MLGKGLENISVSCTYSALLTWSVGPMFDHSIRKSTRLTQPTDPCVHPVSVHTAQAGRTSPRRALVQSQWPKISPNPQPSAVYFQSIRWGFILAIHCRATIWLPCAHPMVCYRFDVKGGPSMSSKVSYDS